MNNLYQLVLSIFNKCCLILCELNNIMLKIKNIQGADIGNCRFSYVDSSGRNVYTVMQGVSVSCLWQVFDVSFSSVSTVHSGTKILTDSTGSVQFYTDGGKLIANQMYIATLLSPSSYRLTLKSKS